MLFGPKGTVIGETLLIVQELFPGDVTGMRIRQNNGPIGWVHLACAALDARSLAGQDLGASLGASVT